ncbi:MAG: adenylyltransferase/cytidyltransferase family protein [Oscillospiraceae bacterium]|nr:adenylyltransferase/cytidyltransferase family protein [Oscillospiraceae bacterium]
MLDPIGVIHGRFQMLHHGHMEYLLAGKKRCQRLIIGISNPDEGCTAFSSACPHRSEKDANPLSYFERYEMIRLAMLEAGVKREEFEIVPFPVNRPELLLQYVPQNARFYVTVYDDWGREKLKMLQNLGCETEVMWERTDAERFTSGTEVRRRMAAGEDWQELVPPSVYRYMTENDLVAKIR